MKDLQILLVEDDRSAALDVEMLLDEMGIILAAIMNNAEDALDFIYHEQPDLIIMDIGLKGEKTGLEVAKEISHLRIPIIFTTSYSDQKIFEDSKSAYSFGYLIKPFNKISLQSALEQAFKVLFSEGALDEPNPELHEGTVLQGTVLVRHVNILYPVRFSEILYIQGEGNYCSIFTIGRKYLLKISLRKLLESLPAHEFSPVHKSFIVRLDKVESIDVGSGKLMVGKEELPLGRNFKATFLERFSVLK
jgi:DNA-binding LytR/AlgR family response regulator